MTYIYFIFGIIFGSFINALVWRIYVKSNSKKKKIPDLSILNGRSMCPKCRHKLSVFDLIPVISWLYLGGQCRYCHKPISIQYPFIELLTGILFSMSYIYWPFSFNIWGYLMFVVWLALLILLISLALYDFKYKILPNNLVYLTILLSLIFVVISYFNYDQGLPYILSRIFGIIFSSGFFYLIFQLSQGAWIGGGDVKLCIALGLLLGGPLETVLMLFIASTLGSLITLSLLLVKKFQPKMTIAFGPLLIIGTYICFFFGTQILNWYTSIAG